MVGTCMHCTDQCRLGNWLYAGKQTDWRAKEADCDLI